MKSISAKLFLAILGLTSLMLVATLLLARWSFDQGFLNYVNSQHQRRLDLMATDLSEYYVENNYRWADDADSAFEFTLRKWFPRARRGHRPRDRQAFSRRDHDDIDRLDGDQPRRRPPPSDFVVEQSERDGELRSNAHNPRRFPRPRDSIVFYGLNGKVIAGNPKFLERMEVLTVDIQVNNKKVGELVTILRVNFNSDSESQFSARQTRASIIITIACLIVAGIASWWLSRMLLAPTVRMREIMGHLARGNYRERVEVSRSDELGTLMTDINRLAETLEKNQQTRKQWLADISHELRTPVAILSGEIEAMLDGIRRLDKNNVESLNYEVGRLKHLIDDLYQLSLSDIGGLRYEFDALDISNHVTNVIFQNRARIDAAEISLNYEIQPNVSISGDASRLEQLFTNLINNSIDYTDAPGCLEIDLRVSDDQVRIIFSDSAPGIEVSKLESLFEPLFRGDDSRNRQAGGAGLGLTICRNIVVAHQGNIDVRAASLGGLTFVITLPVLNKTI